jgi:hypothetical protein
MNMSAQSIPNLAFPEKPDGDIRWNISEFSKVSGAYLGYDELAVFVTNATGENSPIPVQGVFSEYEDYLIFTPYYPFENGLTYTVRTKDLNTGRYFDSNFVLEATEKRNVAELLHIYPSAEELPENLLRFYLYFNSPMRQGKALKHIHLVDSNGDKDTQAFMQFKHELWSPDGKRLTLLFDPGRIKRGVSTNLELGPALLEGNTYQLEISGDWQDIYGQKLCATHTKTFKVGAAYRTAIDISSWNVNEPEVASTKPLTIQLDRIMDYALVQSMIQIRSLENQNVQGNWEISETESVLHFTPDEKWQNGNYEIVLDSSIEDVTGNNLNSLLDDQIKPDQSTLKKTNFSIKFEIN